MDKGDINSNHFKACCKNFKQRKIRLFIVFIIFSTTVPLLTIYFCGNRIGYNLDKTYTCVIDHSYRVPCGQINNTCDEESCCYDPVNRVCYHRIPSAYNYKKVNEIYVPIKSTTPFSTYSIEKLMMSVKDINVNKTQIILHDTNSVLDPTSIADKNYIVKKDNSVLGVEVFRKSSLEMLLTTFRGPLIASDGYWEWTFQLTTEKLVGLGEIVFKDNETVSKVIYKHENDGNTLPIFMAYSNGSFHGALVEHDGPLEVTVLPSKLIILKSLAGSKIILNLYVGGANAVDVVNQMETSKSNAIPYWVLGAHICRDGITTLDLAIDEYKKFQDSEEVIHYSSDCIHENLHFMLDENNEIRDELKKLIAKLQENSHFMLSITPHVHTGRLLDKAVELDLLHFYKNSILNGSYLGKDVVYPDFSHKSIDLWMNELKVTFPANKIDGFALRNNWPVNDNYEFDNKEKFTYLTKDIITSLNKTIPFDAYSKTETPPILHILKHNQYGAAQAKAFKRNFKYDFLMTSSYDYDIQDGALIQNVNISWPALKKAIKTTLYHNSFGRPLISIPICGSTKYYNNKVHEELCMRWYLMTATFPVFRVSSEMPRRDPSNFASNFAKHIALNAIQKRLKLAPYFYTVVNRDNMLVKPMFYNFHYDKNVWSLDEQYMVGDALLVAQPVVPHSSKLQVYLPPSAEVWYEFWGGQKYNAQGWRTIDFVESDWIMFIQQGHIVPLRNAKQSTVGSYSLQDTFTFSIALNCTNPEECRSDGLLMFTSVALKLSVESKALVISNVILVKEDIGCKVSPQIWPSIIESVIIYGHDINTLMYSNFEPIDLCKINLNEIRVNIF